MVASTTSCLHFALVNSRLISEVLTNIQEYQLNEKSANTLMSAIDVMKEKNVLLEKSLSAETRLKLDLFSALGECKRQLELAHGKENDVFVSSVAPPNLRIQFSFCVVTNQAYSLNGYRHMNKNKPKK